MVSDWVSLAESLRALEAVTSIRDGWPTRAALGLIRMVLTDLLLRSLARHGYTVMWDNRNLVYAVEHSRGFAGAGVTLPAAALELWGQMRRRMALRLDMQYTDQGMEEPYEGHQHRSQHA
jgi:hypothetical protein